MTVSKIAIKDRADDKSHPNTKNINAKNRQTFNNRDENQ